MRRSQVINTVGGTLTTVVLVIIVITKFTHGAWLVLVAMPILFVLMKAINRHYSHVAEQLVPDTDSRMLPSKVHASCWCPRCTSRRCGRWPSPAPPAPTR